MSAQFEPQDFAFDVRIRQGFAEQSVMAPIGARRAGVEAGAQLSLLLRDRDTYG